MSPKITVLHVLLFILANSILTIQARENVLERDGKPIFISRRRVGQDQTALMKRLGEVCPDSICGSLVESAVTPLLAIAPECSQQDMADDIIDASRQFDSATQARMIAIAVEYRQLEKNTPDLLNSVFCQRPPRNVELYGFVQAQDPANNPGLFFDPALKGTVLRGSQPNTLPPQHLVVRQVVASNSITAEPSTTQVPSAAESQSCARAVTVKVFGTPIPIPSDAVVVVYGSRSSTTSPSGTTPVTAAPLPTGASFGRCSSPEIEFGAGYDNRQETSFRPADQTSYNSASSTDISIIAEFICNALTNTCEANQAAKDLCSQASQAALTQASGTGSQADAFNAVFGISTTFTVVVPLNNQGNPITTSSSITLPSVTSIASSTPQSSSATSSAVTTTAVVVGNGSGNTGGGTNNGNTGGGSTTDNTGGNTNGGANTGGGDNAAIGNFGSCPTPQILFGNFVGQRETSFVAVSDIAFNQGPSTNINVIANAICDRVTDTCQADGTAIATCNRAKAAAASAANGTGAAADAFNRVFGINTNFAAVQALDNQGRPITGSGSQPAPSNNNSANNPNGNRNTNNAAGGNASPNLQAFSGSLGGVNPPPVTSIGNGQFQVESNTFNTQKDAVVRSCNLQKNLCSNAANASGNANGFTVEACTTQENQCVAQAG